MSARIFILMLLVIAPSVAVAYQEHNHTQLGSASTDDSNLSVYLPNELRIAPDTEFRESGSSIGRPPRDWIAFGCKEEDVPAIRVLNHFYNPLDNQPLLVHGLLWGATAPAWALEDIDDTQEWSLTDARDAFFEP